MINNEMLKKDLKNDFFIQTIITHYGELITIEHFGITAISRNNREVGFSFENNKFYDLKTGIEINDTRYFLMQSDFNYVEKYMKKRDIQWKKTS